jgi:hypothetical protein
MLSNEASARLCSHVARLNERIPKIVDDAVASLAAAFPGVRSCVPNRSRQQRFEAAQAVAYVCKNIASVRSIEAWLEMMGENAFARGFDPGAARQAAPWAIVDAVRKNAGADWSGELENDWQNLAELVCDALARGSKTFARPEGNSYRLAA